MAFSIINISFFNYGYTLKWNHIKDKFETSLRNVNVFLISSKILGHILIYASGFYRANKLAKLCFNPW